MSDVKWIKIAVDIFDNRKIKQIEKLPEGDRIIAIWLKILCLAGTVNDCGMIYLTRDIPYTEQTLATEFNRPLEIVQIALNVFQRFGMIDIVNDFICVSNWEKYQNIDALERVREQTRIRTAEYRKRLSASCDVQRDATVTLRDGTDKKEDKKENKKKKKSKESVNSDTLTSPLEIAIVHFKEHRKKLGKPMTDYAVELLRGKLSNMAGEDEQKKVELIDYAISKGWMGVYPKDKESTPPRPPSGRQLKFDEKGNLI